MRQILTRLQTYITANQCHWLKDHLKKTIILAEIIQKAKITKIKPIINSRNIETPSNWSLQLSNPLSSHR